MVLKNWSRNPTNTLILNNSLFYTVKLVRNTIKRKFTYNGQGITFDGKDSWSFYNDYPRNIAISCVDKNLSIHTDNQNNKFLVLGEEPTTCVNCSHGTVNQIQHFPEIYITMGMKVTCM